MWYAEASSRRVRRRYRGQSHKPSIMGSVWRQEKIMDI
uniref:Uncharacterized protein n=1 Tax=Klebsiella pneumoniae TaxID=573 RepID=A0A455TKQ8_KLEPN|nr:hypothetical protein KK477_p0425 [Klebsiella pneumoniae]BBI29362.1 hypothetical protein [Klebsiella pneumoniae]